MPKKLSPIAYWFLFLLALVLVGSGYQKSEKPVFMLNEKPVELKQKLTNPNKPVYRENFVFPAGLNAYNHASSLIELDDGNILSVWYGGSREGAADVRIFKSVYNPETKSWSTPGAIISAAEVTKDVSRYVKKIGNPVLHMDTQKRIWLFFVTVSVGGWSGSSLNYIVSADNGQSWSNATRLVTSPFLNVSTLVKGQPFNYQDGSIGLPVYHELMGKFSELLRIDVNGTVLEKNRITGGRRSLQPSIALLDEKNAIALMRYSGKTPKRILAAKTNDGGVSWLPSKKISLPNPNSGLMVRADSGNRLLLVFNNTERGRHILSLAVADYSGKSWKVVHDFENSPAESDDRFSYPYFIKTATGDYHLTYTWKKHRIKHVVFNAQWLSLRENKKQ
jgi:predicted neuraminidase